MRIEKDIEVRLESLWNEYEIILRNLPDASPRHLATMIVSPILIGAPVLFGIMNKGIGFSGFIVSLIVILVFVLLTGVSINHALSGHTKSGRIYKGCRNRLREIEWERFVLERELARVKKSKIVRLTKIIVDK